MLKICLHFHFFAIISLVTVLSTFYPHITPAQDIQIQHTYTDLSHQSQVFGYEKFYRIYLPTGYESGVNQYPVIYFFHGWGGRHFKDDNARLEYELLKTLVDKYQVIMVMCDGNMSEEEPRPYNIGNHEDVKFQVQMKDYFPELVSTIDSNFRTLADRQHRGIIGFSMGGIMSFYLAGKYPDMICAAANLHGSPEFFIGYPHNHTLYPVRYTFKNLQDVHLLLHNSTNDELFYLNEEVNKGARWEGNLHYTYELFPGDHKIDDPGKTVIFEKAMRFVTEGFQQPLVSKEKWSHCDIYPEFKVWDYSLKSDKNVPGFISLNKVDNHGFGLFCPRWLPDGPDLNTHSIQITTAAVYEPFQKYYLTRYWSNDVIELDTVISNQEGRLELHFDSSGVEVGIYSDKSEPNLVANGYRLENNQGFIRVGTDNNLKIKIFNRGAPVIKPLTVKIELTTRDSNIHIKNSETLALLMPGDRISLSDPFIITYNKIPPEDGAPAWIKLALKINVENNQSEDEIIVPVFFDVPLIETLRVDDGYLVRDSIYGIGDGDGIAEPGEHVLVYANEHRTRLYTDDPFVETSDERLIDEILPAKWPDGYTRSSVIKISEDCPKGHVIELLANYETKSFMPIQRKVTWGRVRLRIGSGE